MSSKYVFVGERRSNKAIKMGVTWNDGRLSAKTLFEALEYCNIPIDSCLFCNLWDDKGKLQHIPRGIIIGMGRKVQKELSRLGIKHISIVHPAARGKIRTHRLYLEHVKGALKNDQKE